MLHGNTIVTIVKNPLPRVGNEGLVYAFCQAQQACHRKLERGGRLVGALCWRESCTRGHFIRKQSFWKPGLSETCIVVLLIPFVGWIRLYLREFIYCSIISRKSRITIQQF